jgi:multisubunit Na+/H+ antiporter MnhG subunit
VSFATVVTALLLAAGIGALLLASAGLLVVRGAYARLHCASLGAVAGPLAVALAVLVEQPGIAVGWRAVLIAILSAATSAVATHAMARAIRLRDQNLEEGP